MVTCARALLAAGLLAASLCLPAAAQEAYPEPPYEQEMKRLAEILGAVHYLRGLCGADEGQTWRSMMQQLIDSENPGPERKAALVDSFNRGYRSFEQSYHLCNATAVWIIDSYMKEGAQLAQTIASRYGE